MGRSDFDQAMRRLQEEASISPEEVAEISERFLAGCPVHPQGCPRPELLDVRADELCLEDQLEEGVSVLRLSWDTEDSDRVWVGTNGVSPRILWPRDKMVRVIRGPHQRPGLNLAREERWT